MESWRSFTDREYAQLRLDDSGPFLCISLPIFLINSLNGGKTSGKPVTNNHDKNLESGDS